MNERPADKLWKDLPPEQVDHFFKKCASRAELLGDLAHQTSCELAKYLFAANTGAAAGIFFLLKSSPGHIWYLLSFFSFCAGTFFVGVSYLTLASWCRELSDGWSQDMSAWGRNEITIAAMDANNRVRHASFEKTAARLGLAIAFGLLIAGGLTAAIPLL